MAPRETLSVRPGLIFNGPVCLSVVDVWLITTREEVYKNSESICWEKELSRCRLLRLENFILDEKTEGFRSPSKRLNLPVPTVKGPSVCKFVWFFFFFFVFNTPYLVLCQIKIRGESPPRVFTCTFSVDRTSVILMKYLCINNPLEFLSIYFLSLYLSLIGCNYLIQDLHI